MGKDLTIVAISLSTLPGILSPHFIHAIGDMMKVLEPNTTSTSNPMEMAILSNVPRGQDHSSSGDVKDRALVFAST
ncbi:hypothetical protein PIB30_076216 [Stylosanthes scabra]|uniref:Uncharacterized protein n=1 Tax=Stylosanthes scabra TaxID=79078 RepID=A0ABU6QQ92_9FABA|nr:hypothetical protein [Stylosanthes scabra]